jgi:hypothetical protein
LKTFSLTVTERHLFADVPEHTPSDRLTTTLKETVPLGLALSNERARSELIITPMLVEVRRSLNHRVGLFSGIELDVDASRGLNGICDFLLSRGPEQMLLKAPVLAVVDAKQENIRGGVAQCAAEMYAAQRYNSDMGQPVAAVYGAITTGDNWRFLELRGNAITLDADEYLLHQTAKILGILRSMVS